MKKRLAVLGVAVAILAFVGLRWNDEFDPSSLRDKVVLITGASTGIGEQLAYQYASTGAALILTARRQHVLLQVAARCRHLGSPRVEIVAGDMGDPSHRQEVVDKTQQLFGRLDYLILNHMINYPGFWQNKQDSVATLEQILSVNFVAYVDLATRTLDLLERNGGAIGVLSSVAGNIGMPSLASYSASKFALEGFFAALRQELILQKKNVTVTICVLGFIATENAMNFVREKLDHGEATLAMASQPNDTAAAIMESVFLKKAVMYYPSSSYWAILGHRLFPGLLERVIREELVGSGN